RRREQRHRRRMRKVRSLPSGGVSSWRSSSELRLLPRRYALSVTESTEPDPEPRSVGGPAARDLLEEMERIGVGTTAGQCVVRAVEEDEDLSSMARVVSIHFLGPDRLQ